MASSNVRQSSFWKRTPAFTPSRVELVYSSTAHTDTAADLAPKAKQQPAAAPEPAAEPATEPEPRTADLNPLAAAGPPSPPVSSTLEDKFQALLSSPHVDLEQLKKLSWKGIPSRHRRTAWQLLMGYLPLNGSRRAATVARKRKEYADWTAQTFQRGEASLDRQVWHQIRIDVPRTRPDSPVIQHVRVQRSLERALYCWAVRHPASGYVQGINDLLTPFYCVFLGEAEVDSVSDQALAETEADAFWCLTRLLDGIQDNYTHAQPGIQRQVVKLRELVSRINRPLADHLSAEGIEFIQFAFRWINCLLMREVSLANTVRMWDTYLAEPDGFSTFHIYVCAAFLLRWAAELMQLDFQKAILFLQNPPTAAWTTQDIELLLAEAYMYKCLYHDSPSHYAATATRR
ncbi:RabGAP/TBC [Linderina pennispora]|uniref:RabGAP/TBC n=1 Tax=Linderina pennispora TaxID=61395 RepID=A0A1Y1W1G9_9FUNG|nr:RabGAP/TBC [Linderina pennispora]ORX67379.1 RabGAP/TBC [Linderina pennispora]